MSAHQGASHTDLALRDWQPFAGSADADLLPELDTLTSRSRDLARNDGLMAGGIQTHRDNVVGAVLRLSALPDYRLLGWTPEQAREWGNKVEAHFRSWADTTDCDAARTLDLLGLTVLALGGEMVNGDAVAIPKWLPRPDSPWATRLSVIEADRLETPPHLQGMARIRRGVEFDREGAPVAYHFQAAHPGDALYLRGDESMDLNRWERVPAFTPWGRRRVVHLHSKERTGQSRGKPIVSAVMREFHMAGKYAQNELQASLANSLVAAFLESDLSQEAASSLFGEDPRDAWKDSVKQSRSIGKLQAGAVIPLPVGARLQSFTPGRPNVAFEAFMQSVERRIAAGMNLPYELFAKDFSKVNYSSARASPARGMALLSRPPPLADQHLAQAHLRAVAGRGGERGRDRCARFLRQSLCLHPLPLCVWRQGLGGPGEGNHRRQAAAGDWCFHPGAGMRRAGPGLGRGAAPAKDRSRAPCRSWPGQPHGHHLDCQHRRQR